MTRGYNASDDTKVLIRRLANTARHGGDTTELRRVAAEARIRDYAKHVAAQAPPLSADAVERIAGVIRGAAR
ncbi:hypothetical protein CH253_19835 [Rhodococcus sp. 06-156-3C]|nr:hypothetical protein CH267_14815 [Rhodococcus sp. 06-621-2]OZD07687.1 hypothetical protein CH280_25460 [Rhodococcus sp. 06-156-4C]OZD17101.1 hypothetical protein CH253_19835 [Rhodococcus sp. 06-156-3C]OZD18439.1 hypothetical protein CH248_16655 [Rhodococcus sp. 06-156-4a]OZD28360.1 hypothetical protein CH284_29010 [Rhodococcus sp. 06-156-3]OZD29871.1 hypothetical protein CH247_15840 [Rhodococcus sp. 06-156-3b]OZF57805.1 hypothetical protein CH290_25165 [Rhodococcus sp. 06-156-4]